MVSLITCTGGRPEAFALCERWISEQTYSGPIQWVVVDDVEPRTKTFYGQKIICPNPSWAPGKITLARNILAGLERVKYDRILFIEDDDFYHRDYVSSMVNGLESAPLVGQVPAQYYNIKHRAYRVFHSDIAASLCQTGIRADLIPELMSICNAGNFLIDKRLYARNEAMLIERKHVIGIKGMPGRAGIGAGHRPKGNWDKDPELVVFRNWVGDVVAKVYEKFF